MRAVYDLVNLTPINQAVRQLPFQDDDLGGYLPLVAVDDLDYRLTRTSRTDQTVPARALDTPAPIIARPGVIEVKGGLIALSAMDLLTETDMHRARRIVNNNGAGQAADWQLLANAAAIAAVSTILNTLTLLQGQALFTGALSVAVRNSAPQTADFGLGPTQKVAAAIPWTSTGTATALSDLLAWNDAYIARAGVPAGEMRLSRQYLALAMRNVQLINAIKGSTVGATMVSPAEINSFLQSYGAAPLRAYDKSFDFDNADGTTTTTRVAAANRFALLPPAGTALGRTQLGPTEEAVELVAQRVLAAGQVAGIAVVSMINDDPVQRAMKAAAIGLPVIEENRKLLVGTL